MSDAGPTLAGTTPRVAASRARRSVTVYFVIAGVSLATWTSRIPSVKQRLGLSDGDVSLALLALAIGSVLAMQAAGPLADRFGSARVMAPAGVLMSLSLFLPGYAADLPMLVIGLVLFGAGHGCLDVSMNVHAVEVERRYDRPIMSTFHATFSVGGLVGSLAGALAAHLAIGAGMNLAGVGLVLAALSVIAWPALLPPEPRQRATPASGGPRGIPAAIIFLGTLGFFCSLGEGAMADWTPLYLHDVLHTSPAFAAIGYAVFSAMMATFRFLGDGLVRRFGPVAVVRCCGLVAGLGLGTAVLLHHPVAALVGFGLFGAGLSCIVPQVFSAAGSRDPQRSGRDLAQVSTLSYGGLLAGPVIIGMLSEAAGLSVGLMVPAVLALFVALSAPAVRPPPSSGG